MPTLYHSLSMGQQGLMVSRQGVDTTGHNIANAQVEGYSRQKINIKQRDPLERNGILIGNGVYVGNVSRSHDQFIENQINQTKQSFGETSAKSDGLSQLEIIFSPEQSASVTDEMTTFFSALGDLAMDPEDFTIRTNVVENAKNLTQAFRTVDSALVRQQGDFNNNINNKLLSTNDTIQEIAGLNVRIRTLETGRGQEANDLRDNRDRLVRDLANVIDIHYYEDKDGMMLIRGPRETTLVDRGHFAKFSLRPNADNPLNSDIMISDYNDGNIKNITRDISGGEIAGLIDLRDNIVPGLQKKNNEMAHAFASRFNEVHRQGFGHGEYASTTGRNFFEVPDDVNSAALNLFVTNDILNSQDAISAASTALAPGDNVIANELSRLKSEKMLGAGQVTANEFYADYIGVLGLEVVRSEHLNEANKILMADLEVRREAVAGVSLDEEATNLLKWQSNFTASSKVITTVDEMLETVLSLKR